MCKAALQLYIIIFICFSGILFAQPVSPIANKDKNIPYYEYTNRIMDIAFPSQYGVGPTERILMRLRYLPSFNPESQIIIKLRTNSEVEIRYMIATTSIQAIRNSGIVDIEKAAKLTKVKSYNISITSQLFNSWLTSFWNAYGNSINYFKINAMSDIIRLDGIKFQLDYFATDNHISIEIASSELNDKAYDSSPIVEWMLLVRSSVEELLTRSKSKK
jgi:hypothetical protein